MTMTQMVNQKRVTIKDIAEEMGVSQYTAWNAYHGKGRPENIEKAQNIAKKMGYVPIRGCAMRPGATVSIHEIARKFDVSTSAVRNALKYEGKQCPRQNSVRQKIRDYAQTVGYTVAPPKQKAKRYYHNGNFQTKQEEHARMLELRSEGYSNWEIARKIGRSLDTIYRNIGKQPEDMTRMNVAEGQRNRAKRNANRRTYVMTHEINQHNELVEKAERISADIHTVEQQLTTLRREHAEMTEKIASNVPHIRKLSQQVGVPMKELPPAQINLSELAPTAIQ